MEENERSTDPEGGKEGEGRDFDSKLARLERIVQEMEQGGLGLEEAIGAFEEGVGLLKGCRQILAGYRRQVEELTKGAEETLRPYAADPDLEDRD